MSDKYFKNAHLLTERQEKLNYFLFSQSDVLALQFEDYVNKTFNLLT